MSGDSSHPLLPLQDVLHIEVSRTAFAATENGVGLGKSGWPPRYCLEAAV